MEKPLRLAFGYQARVGKDTAAAYLVQRDGGKLMSFAKAIYDIMSYAQQRCGFPQEKDRHFLQYVGTQWARAKDPDVWLNVVLREIDSTDPGMPIFITDVRFPNEFDALEARGFTMVNIRRDELVRAELGGGSKLHESETALIPYTEQERWHHIINNDGTLENFYAKLDYLFPPSSRLCPACSRLLKYREMSCIFCYAPNGMNDDQGMF